jgi:hypothetical protein
MNAPKTLEQRLSAAFGSLDVGPDFDSRLMNRLRTEACNDAAAAARLAREREEMRYGAARRHLHSWRRWSQVISRVMTLERAGIAALVIGVVATTWSPAELRENAPLIITVLGVLAALAPFVPAALAKASPFVSRQVR